MRDDCQRYMPVYVRLTLFSDVLLQAMAALAAAQKADKEAQIKR